MPVVALINGEPFAVYTDHLNTPRRLTDAQGRPRWQWAFSGFGEQAAQSIPRTGLPTVSYSLRYPGQVDDGNGLFYNFNRFYDPLVGRYTNADPIGLDGGWNRFGYVGGNAFSFIDPLGLAPGPVSPNIRGGTNSRGPTTCTGNNCVTPPFDLPTLDPKKKPWWPKGKDNKGYQGQVLPFAPDHPHYHENERADDSPLFNDKLKSVSLE
jgi:RHS repeat-associated protein